MSIIVRLAIATILLVLAAEPGAALTGGERECQESIALAGRRIFSRSLTMLASCRREGACTRDPAASLRHSATEAIADIGGKCTDSTIASLSLGGDCRGLAKDVASLAACLSASHQPQAAILTAIADPAPLPPSHAAEECGRVAARETRRFALARLALLQQCKGSPRALQIPPGTACAAEPRTLRQTERRRARAFARIGAACSAVVAEIPFGAPCDESSSANELARCLLGAAENAAEVALEAEYPDPGFCEDGGEAVERKIDALLARMTLAEKVEQMHGTTFAGVWRTPANQALGIPGLGMIDGPRGVSSFAPGKATSFPVAMARGASWDESLERRVGEAIGSEARAKGAGVLLAPTMNILRHPRWGRAQETYGEDPFHLGSMATAFTRGVQEHAMANLKHFAVNSIEDTRLVVDVSVDERSLREIYLRHFQMAVERGHAASVMAAYNSVNGQYCAENEHLLSDVLKGDWGFRGFVESDWLAAVHSTAPSALAGLDIEMPVPLFYGARLIEAVAAGDVSEAAIDDAVRRILRAQFCFRLDTDPPIVDPSRIETAEHLDLALESARAGIVLLRNEGAALPVDRAEIASLVVLGPLAAIANLGDTKGSSNVAPSFSVAPLDGIEAAAANVAITYIAGPALSAEELASVGAADAVVVVAGLTVADEGEGFVSAGDRETLGLSAEQEGLIAAAGAANPRTIVVLEGGSAIAMPWANDVAAILMAWYPGQRGGEAIADVLFGDVNPSGKLPISFPVAEADLPPFDNRSTAVTYGYDHGYRWLDREGTSPLFPFGFGLSYTTFAYSNLKVEPAAIAAGGRLRVTVDVTNTGDVAGDEVVQLYVGYAGSAVDRAVKDLKAFARTHLEVGETRTVPLEVRAADLAFYDVAESGWQVEPIEYTVRVGGSSADLPLEGTFTVVQP